jgi:intracellular septation protein A
MEKKKNSFFTNLAVNIIIPVIILSRFSGEAELGPVYALMSALAFPLAYGIYDLLKNKHKNIISLIGLISILLTGGISLLQLPPQYIAIKEALVPFIIGIMVLGSLKMRYPLFRQFVYRPEIFKIEAIENAIYSRGNQQAFESSLKTANVFVSLSFFLSAVLNYLVAVVIVQSPPLTEAYNEELGRMAMLSYPVIVVPSMIVMVLALWWFIKAIKRLSGLSIEQTLNT